jgi:hypothetical protein
MLLLLMRLLLAHTQIVQLTTFGVNYVGHPFNSGLMENAGMQRSLRYSSCFLALLVSQAVPPLNERWVGLRVCVASVAARVAKPLCMPCLLCCQHGVAVPPDAAQRRYLLHLWTSSWCVPDT